MTFVNNTADSGSGGDGNFWVGFDGETSRVPSKDVYEEYAARELFCYACVLSQLARRLAALIDGRGLQGAAHAGLPRVRRRHAEHVRVY